MVAMMKKRGTTGLVYSSEHGRMCPACGKPAATCQCQQKAAPKGDGIVRVGRETKGRKGGGVTIITGLSLPPEKLKALASQLKKQCGTGGTVKNGVIEIQGEHRDLLMSLLQNQGFTVKRAGG